MKNTVELLAIVDDICPDIKSSERLFIVGLIMDEQKAAYNEASERALELIEVVRDEK